MNFNFFDNSVPHASIKAYDPKKHYEILASWWTDHKWPVIPSHLLPPTGWVVYNKEEPVIAGFMYFTDSPIAILEWIISNPSSKKEQRGEAISILLQQAKLTAQEEGAQRVFSFIAHPSLEKHYEAEGFVSTDRNMTIMIYTVEE